jgi:alpha-L-fucosidase
MTYSRYCCLFLLTLSLACTKEVSPPEPFGATPSERQLSWHDMEYYAFVHFNMNTFSGEEWGHGEEPPSLFNPTELDCRQWARIAKEAGMKGIVITAKHHDGFCLWDSEYTDHDVASSDWRDGQGDVLQDLAEACQEYGLKMGVYLSPWDQNSPVYGTDGYNEYFMKQLSEVLTNYGDIFEVWFDGAVGPEYKGKQPYDWGGFIATVREHQPDAVIFSDAGPDIRWVGTEKGFANPTNWATLNRDDYFPGTPRYVELRSGNKNGTHWLPAEVDVSIRPGWYYHASEDDQVKSADHLELIYYNSVGRNANLLLNLPVDRRGLVHENDSAALMQLRQRLDATFSDNLVASAKTTSKDTRSRAAVFAEANLNDGDPDTYWATKDEDTTGSFTLRWPDAQTFNVVELEEYIPLGQRVEAVAVDAWLEGDWQTVGEATSIGNKRWIRIPTTTTDRLRIRITDAMACPVIREVGIYYRPHDNYLLESKKAFDERMSWWRDAKFGMFIHWGAYAVPAGRYRGKTVEGVGEWIMNTAQIPIPEYETYVEQFDPVDFDAQSWARLAKEAGMEYMVITSKHHDGFCLWDSEVTDYDIMDAAPYQKDILRDLKEACDAEGIRLGFYHSIMDWHHPDASGESFPSYRDEYLIPQVRELVTEYDPAILWFDGEWIGEWSEPQGKDLYQAVRSMKPDILVNNRVGKGRQGMQGMNRDREYVGDFGTPEQEILDYGSAELDWESCMTMNDSWGFKADDDNWKSPQTLVHNLIDVTAKGGNYLLNVGPDARGLIPAPSVERLQAVGRWLDTNAEAIKNTTMWTTWEEGETIRYTQGVDGQVYAIALEWPGEALVLKNIRPAQGTSIELLGYADPIQWDYEENTGLTVQLPPREEVTVKYAWVFRIRKGAPIAAID